ncbi:hypothetical protein AJ78_00514 [Emergomyces pasteurianus Ep9510]|uniref:Uncharacterized protein n=1 Tax=Emergomyces pasteurianus Ep9510 TaxID=1447872 RepID=A0A1J9QTL7_9EURO|nr:hypothetical protein AJ78_00514 [Emergomyces pasteurianus Ep9510]
MAFNPQAPSTEGHTMEGEVPPVNLLNDEAGLSPMSKKILDKCAIPVTPGTKDFSITPTLISRPAISDLDTGELNFHFAKPKLPTPNFTSRSKTILDGGIVTPSNKSGVGPNTWETDRPDIKCTDSRSRDYPAHLNGEASKSRKASLTKSPNAKRTARTSCTPKGETSSEETVCILENGYRVDGQSENDTPEQGSYLTDNHNGATGSAPQEDHTRTTPNACTPSPASSHHYIREPNPPPARPLVKDARLRPKLMLNPKITKRPISPRLGSNYAAARQATIGTDPSFAPQLSEQDLFYMLILRLKKRDEMDAETTAMKERMEGEMLKLTRVNDSLRCKLRESEFNCENQQAQLRTRDSLVERWKVKFSKLRAFVTGVGTEFEALRKEGQRLKSAQGSLFQEKEQIHETLKQMSNSTDQLKTRWSQHRANISEARQELNSLERSLIMATTKVTDTEKLISVERNRAATMENYIKNYSERHHRQVADIQQKQSQTVTTIDAIHKHLEGSWNFSQSSFKDEMESGFSSCVSLLKLLSQRQTVNPQDLDKVDRAIRDLSSKFNSSIEASTKTMETALDLHTSYEQRVSTQLTDLETAVNSSRAVVGQLAEARELYGRLQEKLNAAEKNLAEVSADRDRLRSQEAGLQRHIGDLKIEISSLQRDEIEDTQFKDADISSELRIQLEATSAALARVTDEFKTKESEIQERELKLAEAIEKLGAAECKITELQSEKLKCQEKALETEHRVREELARANLAAKDQHRAWFEQERHKLTREKLLAEKNLQKAVEELDSVKCSLQGMEKCNHDLITKMNQRQAEIDNLKSTALNRNSDISKEVDEVKALHATTLKELQSAQGQLEAVAKEREELKQQLSELRINLAILQEQEPLQETLEVLRSEIVEKDIDLLSLKKELHKSEESIKRIPKLEQELAAKSTEIANLQEKLDSTLASGQLIEESITEKGEERVTVKQKEEVSRKFPIEISTLPQDVEQMDNELAELKSRVQEANCICENAENILKQLGFIGTGESLRDCSGVLQSRLEIMVADPEETLVKEHTELRTPMGVRASSKRQRTSRKSTKSSTHAECVRAASSTRERQTTELVYRTQSTREIISPTLKTPSSRRININKIQVPTTSRSFIRPFSQLQNDATPVVYRKEPTSPISEIADLNALFPTTPMHGNHLSANQALTALEQNHPQIGEALLLTHECDFGKERNDMSISNAVNEAMCASRRVRESRLPEETICPTVSLESNGPRGAMGSELSPETNARNRCSDATKDGIKNKPCSPFRTSVSTPETKEMSKDEMHTMQGKKAVKKSPEKLPRKGILKDTTKSGLPTVENAVQTPPHENNGDSQTGANPKISFRRPSGRSKYFNPTVSPAASSTSRVGRYGSTANKPSTPTGRTRDRPRRRPRGSANTPISPYSGILISAGDLYHSRFSQKPPV